MAYVWRVALFKRYRLIPAVLFSVALAACAGPRPDAGSAEVSEAGDPAQVLAAAADARGLSILVVTADVEGGPFAPLPGRGLPRSLGIDIRVLNGGAEQAGALLGYRSSEEKRVTQHGTTKPAKGEHGSASLSLKKWHIHSTGSRGGELQMRILVGGIVTGTEVELTAYGNPAHGTRDFLFRQVSVNALQVDRLKASKTVTFNDVATGVYTARLEMVDQP